MRAGVLCAAALALVAVASALRTTQVEGTSRISRRPLLHTPTEESPTTQNTDDASTPRARGSRRRDDVTPRHTVRSKTRTRPPEEETVTETEVKTRSRTNDRVDPRRTSSRTRNRSEELDSAKTSVVRSRTRSFRPAPTPPAVTTKAPEVSSPIIDESKIEVINSTLEEIPKMVFKEDTITIQSRRKSSTSQVAESIAPRRHRRINTRPSERSDLASSGTTNSISISEREPTTDKMIDLRNSRKLRYKQRLSDTDMNLTGFGITAKEATKSSQNQNSITNETTSIAVENLQQSTESNPLKTTTLKVMRIVRRPVQRGKGGFKPSASESKPKKRSDEISDDDNYPELFKALLQAKNASTQTSSPISESLSVKASQKVYKTYTSSQQSTFNSPSRNKYSRLRSKSSKQEDLKTEEKPEESTVAPRVFSTRQPNHKYRASYATKNRKPNTSTTASISGSINQSTEKPSYKFNRKFKPSTTESPKSDVNINSKQVETNKSLKRTLNRPSYYARRNSSKFDVTPAPSAENNVNIESAIESIAKHKSSLPRTSYYKGQRNSKIITSTTEEPFRESNSVVDTADRKNGDNGDMPLIFTLLKPSDVPQTEQDDRNETKTEKTNKMFVIAVTSKESQETSTENEMTSNTLEEIEPKPAIQVFPTPKYHATYSLPQATAVEEEKETESSSVLPPIKNIRKFGRSRTNSRNQNDENTVTRDRGSGKFSDSFSKTTEASTNGIIAEAEKSKTRFSSKYRAAYLDKPFYRATVPTVTPSTAWLKFFVTDRLLTKFVEEPNWFEEDYTDSNTTPMPRLNFTPPIHESSIELIQGEEFQLGPDMNAITFTQTRSPAELLKLSESLVKPSHVMNVEASQHSPSVTVSIFDALAEILTSTPRNRLSSTTEVSQKQIINTDLIQTLNGVSNSINVNSEVLAKDTLSLNVNVNTITNKQDTATPTAVSGRAPTTPQIPVSSPITPVSVRRPFAFKVLYSDTKPTDKLTTAPEPTSNLPTTDNPTMVYNTVSDLLLFNNNVVSSELTSMLSSNINNILRNMDDRTRSRLSADMAKILKSVIPRAIDGLEDNVDPIPNTTPYSLEEIKDTENVEFDLNVNSNNISVNLLQGVDRTTNVHNTMSAVNTTNSVIESDFSQVVNSSGRSQLITSSLVPVSDIPMTSANFDKITSLATTERTTSSPTTASTLTTPLNVSVSSDMSNNDSVVVDSLANDNTSSTNPNVPLPFFTNSQINDFTGSDFGISNNNVVSIQSQPIPFSGQTDDGSNTQDINDVTPLELWILSRKARVLEMIEDLLRTHNNELANATKLTEVFGQTSNSPISARLTEIMTSMNSSDSPNDSFLSTTPSLPALFSTQSSNNSSGDGLVGSVTSSREATARNNLASTASTGFDDISTSTSTTISNAETATSPLSTMETIVDLSNRFLIDSSTATTMEDTTTQSIVTSTATATTISMGQETTTQNDMETTTEVDIETTTTTNDQANNASTFSNQFNTNNKPSIPKKDYVIFGILPNNTVVRKDPNDDILESITEASPYIVYGVLPNNTVIRKFPNGTRVPRVMQKIDILPISPWSLRNPYSPIHNNPAIVRPQSNPIRVSTNVETSSNNETDRLTTIDTVNNLQNMISTSTLNLKDSSSGVTTVANKPAEQSTASHVLSLRTTTMLPSVDEILLNSLSSAAKEDMVISSMTSSTRQPIILTLDIDPETKQIRTEKPGEGNDSAVFKFIPIDEVSVQSQNSNVLKLASSKSPTTTETTQTQSVTETLVTESNTQTPQIPSQSPSDDPTTTVQVTVGTSMDTTTETATIKSLLTTSTETVTTPVVSTEVPTSMATTTVVPLTTTTELTTTTTKATTTTEATTTTTKATTTTTKATTTTEAMTTTTQPTTTTTEEPKTTVTTTPSSPATKLATETMPSTTVTLPTDEVTKEEAERYKEDAKLLEAFLDGTERIPKKLNFNRLDQSTGTTSINMKTTPAMITQQSDEDKFLQALLASAGKNANSLSTSGFNTKVLNKPQTTTSRSIEDDIRQFEEDTKLLRALLQATGQNPANFNIPTLNIRTTTIPSTTETTTTVKPTERPKSQITTSPSTDAKLLQENAKLLQALLQATGQKNEFNIPDISGLSNVRIASNPYTTSLGSSPTTPVNVRPVYTTLNTSPQPKPTTLAPSTTVPPTLQPQTEPTTVRISTTFPPFRQRQPTTVNVPSTTLPTARRVPSSRFAVTTEIPTSSTFSVEEDLAFLNNLKSVLSTNTNNADPEAALANRIIALAVDRSLNEIKTVKVTERTGKNIEVTTTTSTTTTTPPPTTTVPSTPSIEDDIRQFQEDTQLLQALLKATGQDPSKLNLPTLPNLDTKVSSKLPPGVNKDLDLLSNLLASPSPLNEPFDSLTQKPKEQVKTTVASVTRPFGAKIAVKDDVKSVQDDGKLLQTLIQLQGVQETTTSKSKIAITGQSTDEALKKLIQQTKPIGMMQSATKAPLAISTEYGKSQDALLAALLKEQGFGPTTASSLDEQIRLAALLNQVVVTPKARRTTTPPPPPAPRRPILDGLAWLWQQWRDTGPGPGGNRPSRRPEQAPTASVSASQVTSNRVNWFGSGPFTGNADADDRPSANRVPLEPPRAVTSEQTPGRGQLVSAAINVTRAFSQFLGAAIQGAAQTVQSVIRAGQKAATDVYTSGSGASG